MSAGLIAVSASVLVLAACGESESVESGSTPAAVVKQAKADADRFYKGSYELPPTSAPPHERGKNVWAISVGNQAISSDLAAKGFKEAATKLGWDVTVVDGKFDPNRWLQGIRDAIADGADGIYLVFFDCAPVKSALREAEAAGIPVVASESFDCKPGLIDWVTRYSEGTFTDWVRAWGTAQAVWTIANTDGKAKILEFKETDILVTKLIGDAFEKRIADCAGCEIVERIEFTGRDLGTSLQQKAQQALVRHPDVDVVYANYDTPVTSGIAAAVKASGRDPLVIGGEGFRPNLDLMRQGVQSMALGYAGGFEGYSGADALLRIFAGEKPVEQVGMGVQLVDEKHNMPPKGQDYEAPVDWKAAYEKAWGVD